MIRDDVLRKFGPKLIEGLIETLQEQINEIRAFVGMPSKEKEIILKSLRDKEKDLLDYDWMKEEIFKIKEKDI